MAAEQTTITSLVFDFGGVLLDYNLHNVLDDVFPTAEEAEAFVKRVDLAAFCDACDDTEYWTVAERWQKKYPADASVFERFGTDWIKIIKGEIAGMEDILCRLERDYPLYGLTNLCRNFFPAVYEKFKILHHFKDRIIVSGLEEIKKPDAAIFKLLCSRFGLEAKQTLFIDDRPENIKAASALGFNTVLFTDAEDLKKRLVKLGILKS